MLIKQYYKGKVIGVMGHQSVVGKLLLQKIMTELPDIKKIYIIFKADKISQEGDLQKGLFLNKFYEYSKSHPLWKASIAKVEIVQLVESEHNLTINKQNIEKIDILFNCFLPCEPFFLDKAYKRHILFPSKVIKYLKQQNPAAKLVVLSSIYSQKPGYIAEEIEQQLTQVPRFSCLKEIEKYMDDFFKNDYQKWKLTLEILQNIYLKSRLTDVHVIRVPIIGSTLYKLEGFTDKFNSMSLLIYQTGLGKVQQLKGKKNNILDLIPADFVCNYMIALSALDEAKKQIYNLTTSSRNPLRLGTLVGLINSYWNQHPLGQSRVNSKLQIYEKQVTYGILQLTNRIPQFLLEKTSRYMEWPKTKFLNRKNQIITKKQNQIAEKYSFYLNNEWVSDANKSIDLYQKMNFEERKVFNFNINEINWNHYIMLYCFGIQKYILGVNAEHLSSANLDLLKSKGNIYFADIYWAITQGKKYDAKDYKEIKHYVLNSKSVQSAIKELIEQKTNKLSKGYSYNQVEAEYNRIADGMCEQMFSQYSMKTMRAFAWFLHKVFKTIYEQVVIDKASMLKLKSYEQKQGIPIIILPTHRSYIDFLIMSYILFGYGIKCPHIAAAQDFLNMAIVHVLLRKSGAFFIKRNQKENRVLYKAIMTQYVSKILCQRSHLQFFIEGTRSRVGKMLQPKYGMLTVVIDTVLSKKIPDATIVPVTINYERVLEGASFPYQLLGEPKVKQSLGRLIKAVDVLKENYGRIYIEICQPISIKEYFKEKAALKMDQKAIINELGYQIVYNLSDNLVIMPPAIVASIVLMQRKGISEQSLNTQVQWLCKQIQSRGIKIARTQVNSAISVSVALNFLGDIVTKTKKNVFELDLSLNQQSTNIFMLSYYRNTLTHIFFLEAIVLTAINSFGHKQTREQGIVLESLKVESLFLYKLLKKQYVLRDDMENPQVFSRIIDFLVAKKIIQIKNNLIFAMQKASKFYSFECSLIWPLIQSYWLTVLYLFNLRKLKTSILFNKLLGQIQWFGQSMIQQRVIEHYESISQDTIKNAIGSLNKIGLIKIIKEQVQGVTVQSVVLSVDENKLKFFQIHLSRFLKSTYAKSVKGIVDSSRSTVMIDFPFLAKL